MIELKSVCLAFKDFALKDINLFIEEGEFFVILGPSGSGKTLLLEMMAGLIKPDSGEVQGTDKKRIGLIYQDYMLFPHLNVFQNISYGLRVQKLDKIQIHRRVQSASDFMEISHLHNRDVSHLSGGEKQRVAIARAMVMKPDLFLLDEPTSSLDLHAKTRAQRCFMDLHKQNTATFVHVTHDFEEALALGDRIALLIGGKIIQIDKPDVLFSHPVSMEAASFLGFKNVFSGPIVDFIMSIPGAGITTPVKHSSHAYAALRSNDIILSKAKIQSSARNSFQGKIFKIIRRGAIVEVLVNIGLMLHVDITQESYEEMALREGDPIWTTFKTTSIKIFEHQ